MTRQELTEAYSGIAPLLDRIAGDPACVAIIDGPAGAGKTTLARALGALFGANVYHADDYFLPPARKTAARLAQPGGNLDYERMAEEITRPLAARLPVVCRRYDCATGGLLSPVAMPVGRVSVIEGVYTLHPALRVPGAVTVFLAIGEAAQRARILARSGPAVLARYEREWLPLERAYFDAFDPAAGADFVFRTDAPPEND